VELAPDENPDFAPLPDDGLAPRRGRRVDDDDLASFRL
jgi:hypothetical protein